MTASQFKNVNTLSPSLRSSSQGRIEDVLLALSSTPSNQYLEDLKMDFQVPQKIRQESLTNVSALLLNPLRWSEDKLKP